MSNMSKPSTSLLLNFVCGMFHFKGIHLTRQETCRSPGNLTAPKIFNSSDNDTVLLKCKVPASNNFTRVIFCKDEVEMKSLRQIENKYAYEFGYNLSATNSELFYCMYQFKNDKNKVTNSQQSEVIFTSVSGPKDVNTFSDHQNITFPLGIVHWRTSRERRAAILHTETENQQSNQSTNSFEEEEEEEVDSHSLSAHVYVDVQKTQKQVSTVYSTVGFKEKFENESKQLLKGTKVSLKQE
ncbi:hypothetical protein JRQ81_005559 [Phrynocephalus forsythii]|uniref:Uncharacterized protein n=1 Tax=Phrynocephalus forsythii TaxID=171643 RepID=A0A9Q1AVY0_9SAUR|nr:hypothetical protein JRQ81_005559 [Phrynocephalus forsythii]